MPDHAVRSTAAPPAAPAAPAAPKLPKLATGIPGFDLIAEGGLPAGRATLVAGTAGSGKTVFATHFLAAGITADEPERAVFVTFEDAPDAIRENMRSFGWDIAGWERDGRWRFVDAAMGAEEPTPVVGAYDFGALVARVEHAVREIGATRVSLDALNALLARYPRPEIVRAELFRLSSALKALGATIVFTGERSDEYGPATTAGVEEFVADNVVLLRNLLVDEKRRRTVEILKFRGARHQRGEVPFTILEQGLVVIPLTAQRLTQTSSTKRVTSGVPELDAMCGGGFFRDSVVLVSGATGTGKTLLVTQFLAGGAAAGERCLFFAFEESREQLVRNAAAWGMDFERLEREGQLRIVTQYPHAQPLEDHFVHMRDEIEAFAPDRVALDSISALERMFPARGYREFIIGLTSLLKMRRTAGLFTSTTPELLGGGALTERHISTLTDSIILLRYVEARGEMLRGLTVLKMRGSAHDHDIRRYTIDGAGMHVGEPFREVSGILSGHPVFEESPHASGGADGTGAATRG
jgi:circadian clock protein KaiC